MDSIWTWTAFNAFVLVLLALDLAVFHRRAHAIGVREALGESAIWIALALGLGVLIRFWKGPHAAVDYFTGYVVEESLSVDNLFVFLMLFGYFRTPPRYRHRVLFWGIVGALVMRGLFIFAGVTLIRRFDWLLYVLGGFLVVSGVRLAFHTGEDVHPGRNPVVRLARRIFPVTRRYHDGHFFKRRRSTVFVTPLFIVLLAVETTDVLFAVDSVPAVFAITRDPFIIYSSNVMAILGLRALFFALAGIIERFRYLHYGLAVILTFMGAKMLLEHWAPIPTPVALAVVVAVLGASMGASAVVGLRRGSGTAGPGGSEEGEGRGE